MFYSDQKSYEANYSKDRMTRRLEAQDAREKAVSEAHALFEAGAHDDARERLLNAGIPEDGVELYLSYWR